MEELFDVLNERGEYIGRIESRNTCHKEGLWHKAVVVFIINSKQQVLLQKRSANKRMWPNTWDVSSGGHVLAGEFGFQAAIREAKEELGIELSKNDIIFIGSVISDNAKGDIIARHMNEYYIAQKDIDIDTIELQLEEVSEVKWVDKNEIIERTKNNYDGITDKQGCWEYLVKYYEWEEQNK